MNDYFNDLILNTNIVAWVILTPVGCAALLGVILIISDLKKKK